MNVKVMIVEDESIVALELSTYLEDNGYEVLAISTNANDAYKKALNLLPEIILMDIKIRGDEDGITLAKKIKQEINCAIIYITAFSDDKNLDRAIESNPASYLIKPFNYKELSAAIKIATKRLLLQEKTKTPNTINLDESFTYNPFSKELFYEQEQIHLTKQEQELLSLLVQAKGQLVSISRVEEALWPEKFPNESTRRGVVSRLRAKLNHQFLETITAQGYRLKPKL